MAWTHISRSIATAGLIASLAAVPSPAAAQSNYIGEIKWVAFDVVPAGWAACDGQILSIAQNTALFALLGIAYGGNGITTFGLPNMQGRFPVHTGAGPGLSLYDLGQVGGEEAHQLTLDELPAHTHASGDHSHAIPPLAVSLPAASGAATEAAASGNVLATATASKGKGPTTGIYGAGPADVSLAPGAAVTAPGATGSSATTALGTGGNQAHSIMSPFLTLRCIIAQQGTFPKRS